MVRSFPAAGGSAARSGPADLLDHHAAAAAGLADLAVDPAAAAADAADVLAGADAHGDQRPAAARPRELVQRLDGEDAAGRADRVAERHAGAVGVGLVR